MLGWILYASAFCLVTLYVYGLAWSSRIESKRIERWERRQAERARRTDDERMADLWWWAFRKQEYQAALSITARRAMQTQPERVAEMFSLRVTDTPTLKEVV